MSLICQPTSEDMKLYFTNDVEGMCVCVEGGGACQCVCVCVDACGWASGCVRVCVSVCVSQCGAQIYDSIHLRCIVATVSQQTGSVVTKAEQWPFSDTFIYLLIKIYDVTFHRCPPCLHFDTFAFSSEPHYPHPLHVLNWAPRRHTEKEITRED